MSESSLTRRMTHWNSGAIAGTFSSILLQPFDVLRTYTIIADKSKSTLIQGYRVAISNFGIKGMWRGVTPAIYRSILGSGSYFVLLEEFKTLISPTNVFSLGICSGLAKTSVTVLCMPISVIKIRMEAPTDIIYKNFQSGVKLIYKNEGLKGFYRGLLPTIIREVPYSSLSYGFYESYISVLQNISESDRTDPWVTMVSGSLAGLTATLLTQPFDVLRTKIIFQKEQKNSYKNMRSAIRAIYLEDGLLGFQRGLTARVCRRLVSFPLVWTLYEQLKITI